MTVTRMAALNRAWERTPPAGQSLARIEIYLRALAGVPAAGAGADARPRPAASEREDAALDSLPRAPMTKYLTPEQYLAQRGVTDG